MLVYWRGSKDDQINSIRVKHFVPSFKVPGRWIVLLRGGTGDWSCADPRSFPPLQKMNELFSKNRDHFKQGNESSSRFSRDIVDGSEIPKPITWDAKNTVNNGIDCPIIWWPPGFLDHQQYVRLVSFEMSINEVSFQMSIKRSGRLVHFGHDLFSSKKDLMINM